MLAITENAAAAIRQLVMVADLPPSAGLRISLASGLEEADPKLAVSMEESAVESDDIVNEEGANVFVGESASTLLADKVLDASVGEDGRVLFTLGQQGVDEV
jgi:iron-sulfur cluster assembly protein